MIDNSDIINEITTHILSYGGVYSRWYCGITDDSRKRLFTDHKVSENQGIYIARKAQDKAAAEMIVKYFLDKGCQGTTEEGNASSRMVYAFLITSFTKQELVEE